MNLKGNNIYQCPECSASGMANQPLVLTACDEFGKQKLVCSAGHEWNVHNGIPDFTSPRTLADSDWQSRSHYDSTAGEVYDNAIDWIFSTFQTDEAKIRDSMLDKLEVGENARVLEVGCGTGRDTIHLMNRLRQGELWALDLSPAMVRLASEKHERRGDEGCDIRFLVGNCAFLPFPDGYFNAAYHFGGLNEFADKKRALAELSRVVRVGGKVVIGDESLAPWLRDEEYGKILTNNNPLLNHHLPLEFLPANCEGVNVNWILGNTFYVIDFRVLEGLPVANFDLPHKGRRGGTCRTRYFGKLEGVTPDTKALAERAAALSGTSLHDWFEEIVKSRATEVVSGLSATDVNT